MNTMRSVAVGLVLAACCAGQEGTRVFISRCIQCHDREQRVARAAARSAGQPALAGHSEGARDGIDESHRRAAERGGQDRGGALSGQGRTGGDSGDEGLLRGGRQAQSRRLVVEWMGRG